MARAIPETPRALIRWAKARRKLQAATMRAGTLSRQKRYPREGITRGTARNSDWNSREFAGEVVPEEYGARTITIEVGSSSSRRKNNAK